MKELVRFLTFPWRDECSEIPSLIGTVAFIALVVAVPLRQWLSSVPFSTPILISIYVVGFVTYLFAYAMYRDPGFRTLLGRSCD